MIRKFLAPVALAAIAACSRAGDDLAASGTVEATEAQLGFQTAGRIAFKNAFLAARPALLEPIVDLEVTVPSRFTGAILGDLNTKRARIENQDSLPGDLAVISAKVPLFWLSTLPSRL